MEVCLQGQWGTVCSDSWDTSDAIVACGQLGLDTASKSMQRVRGYTEYIPLATNAFCHVSS